MNRQEIFDKAWNGLKAQGFRRSADEHGSCLYRGPNGLKCAIGHCISDEAFNHRWEGSRDEPFKAAGVGGWGSQKYEWAIELQNAHDTASDPSDMEGGLRRFAKKHKLTIPGEAKS